MKALIDFLTLRARLYRPDGNPLRRRSDRLESAVVLVALFLVLASIWPAVLAGRLTYESASQDERVMFGARQQVMATLLEDVPTTRVSFTEIPVGKLEAAAQWTTPSGEVRHGTVPVPTLADAGAMVPVWLDADGAPVPPPTDESVLQLMGVATGILIVLMTALLALSTFAGFRWWTDRMRYREWDVDWVLTAEKWSRRQRP